MENVQTNSCCQRTAHKDCLYACGWSLTNCNCFQRERTAHKIDYPAPSTSSYKQPSVNDDGSGTWEDHPLQTFPHHSEILSLFCEICGEEEIFIKSPCCKSEYHWHCLNQYRKRGYTTCIYCQLPMQFSQHDLLRLLWSGEDDSGSSGGGRGAGRRGDDGGRVDDDIDGENDGGGSDSQEEGCGRGRSGSMEGDEGDGGGGVDDGGGGVDDGVVGVDDGIGGDDDRVGGVDDEVGRDNDGRSGDDDGGGVGGEGSPLSPPPPLPLRLLLPPLHLLPLPPLPPSADNRDEEENSEGGVDNEGRNENSVLVLALVSWMRSLPLKIVFVTSDSGCV